MICKKSLLTVMGSGFFISDTLIVPFTKEPSKVDFYPLQSERNCLLYVSGSLSCVEQVSTTVPKSAILRFCPSRETCWGVLTAEAIESSMNKWEGISENTEVYANTKALLDQYQAETESTD